jgi:hypothetical protein
MYRVFRDACADPRFGPCRLEHDLLELWGHPQPAETTSERLFLHSLGPTLPRWESRKHFAPSFPLQHTICMPVRWSSRAWQTLKQICLHLF